MEPVSKIVELERLKLNETRITDVGLQKLEGRRKLRALELHQTAVTQKGIERLKAVGPGLEIITRRNC